MNAVWTVLAKEWVENIRARRTLFSAILFGPLLGPLLFAVIINISSSRAEKQAEEALQLPVVGAENAPNLIAFLRQQSVEIEPPPDDPEAAVRGENEEVVLVIPDNFGERFVAGEAAPLTLIRDRSQRESGAKVTRVRDLLRRYGARIGALRLQARGVAPGIMQPLMIAERDLSTAQSRGAEVLAMVPYFLMLGLFVGSMYLAIDTTAGERERKTLEPLLVNPPARWQLALGKLGATTAFALLSLVITVIAFAVAIRYIDLESRGVLLTLSPSTGIKLFFIVAPVALLAAGLQTIVAAFARSFREAQTYVSMVIFVPMVPSLALMLLPLKGSVWMYATPILGQNLLIERLLRGQSLNSVNVAVATLATIGVALLLIWIATRLYYRERFAFSST